MSLCNFIGQKGTISTIYDLFAFTCSGAGNVCFLRRSCTSGYKHETFRLCSSNLSCKYFLVCHRIFFFIFKMANANFKMAAKGDLAIRRIFSVVDMITKPKFSNFSNTFKIGLFR